MRWLSSNRKMKNIEKKKRKTSPNRDFYFKFSITFVTAETALFFFSADTNTLPAITMSAIFERFLTSFLDFTPNPTATGSFEMLRSVFMNPGRADANTLVIGFDREFASHKEIVDTPRSRKWLQAKLRELMHKAMNVKIVFADDPSLNSMDAGAAVSGESIAAGQSHSSAQAPSNAAPASQRFEDDPMIQKALEIFKGEIVNIKR